jgi:hypothetical protein
MDNTAMKEDTMKTGPDSPDVSDSSLGNTEDSAENVAGYSQTVSSQPSRGKRLAKLAAAHGLILLLALCLFAAADSWSVLTGLGIASGLSVVTGILAGLTATTLIHEWFHYLGARRSGGSYDIPGKIGLFVYDWDFASNTVRQFNAMSIAGSVGGAVAIILLWNSVPADTLGRAALRGGAVAGFVFAAIIEWPVLSRTQLSGEPLLELTKINQQVLTRAFIGASIAGVVMTYIFLG